MKNKFVSRLLGLCFSFVTPILYDHRFFSACFECMLNVSEKVHEKKGGLKEREGKY